MALRIRITGVQTGSTHAVNNGFIVGKTFLSQGANSGGVNPVWTRKNVTPTDELSDCRRFYENSWGPENLMPNSSSPAGMFTFATGNVTAGGGFLIGTYVKFDTVKRTAAGNLSWYDLPGTASRWSRWLTNGSRIDGLDPSASIAISKHGFQVQGTAAASSNYAGFQWEYFSRI